MTDRTHFVYEAYDREGLLLYVGMTAKPRRRYLQHISAKPDARGWFDPYVTEWRGF